MNLDNDRAQEHRELKFRDPARAKALVDAMRRALDAIGRPVTVMHVCGTHEQAIARFGLRAILPEGLKVIMGPGCPVCVTDQPEVDEGIALVRQGITLASYGDMLKVPGSAGSLADERSRGGSVEVVYSIVQAVDLAARTDRQVVFFATGFETTAVATAAIALGPLPPNFSLLSSHKYIPPVMEIVAEMPQTKVEGFLAAGHAATITGYGVFEPFVNRHRLPVVVAGFEPLDILAGLLGLLEQIRGHKAEVLNFFPRCVTREGNLKAQQQLWRVFTSRGGRWRGIAHIPNGNLRLQDTYAAIDARRRFAIDLSDFSQTSSSGLIQHCICGNIMSGLADPVDCSLFGKDCTPEEPVGACMVSSEGACQIWHRYGGVPHLSAENTP